MGSSFKSKTHINHLQVIGWSLRASLRCQFCLPNPEEGGDLSNEKKTSSHSIESWLLNRDPYNGLLLSP